MTQDGLPPLRDVIKDLSLSAKKSLGQNFILDLNLTRRIARSTGSLENQTVIEVGPGPGGLTRALLYEGAQKVIAIEKDQRCLAALNQISDHYPGKLEIIQADAFDINIKDYVEGPAKIIANLPYNVGTALLLNWLQTDPWPPWFISLSLMFQKEVAERIIAKENSKQYGRLAVFCNWRTHAYIDLKLPARAFTPSPKVDSALVVLKPKDNLPIECSRQSLEAITTAAFGQRRKMLRQSLKNLSVNHLLLLEEAHINPEARAETIPAETYYHLAYLMDRMQKQSH